MKYRADIDGLRALAVVGVIAFHEAPTYFPGGFLGVDVFFVISGYLISGIILEGCRTRRFSFAEFYLRRARRILPALLVMFAGVTVLAYFVLMPDELERFGSSITASSLFFPNLAMWQETGYFDVAAGEKPLLHLWSLGVEEQFYLIWPVLLVALASRMRRERLTAVIGTIAAFSFALQIVVANYSEAASFFLPITRFWELMIGALLAARAGGVMQDAVQAHRVDRSSVASGAAATLGLSLICVPMAFFHSNYASHAWITPLPVAGAALVIAAGPHGWANRALSLRPIVYVGLISYPLYLWHWPPRSLLRIMGLTDLSLDHSLRFAALAGAVLASILTYHFIEVPLRRQRLRPLAMVLGIGVVIAAAGGLWISGAHGWPKRGAFATSPFLYLESMRNERRCLDQYFPWAESTNGPFCLRNDYVNAPQVVLMGDSHANALWQGVRAAYPRESVLHIGAPACPYLRAVDFESPNDPGRRGKCAAIVERAYRAIETAHVVILGSRATMYTATQEEMSGDFNPNRGLFHSTAFPGATPLEAYEKSLRRDLAFLLENGREVVLVLPIPEMHFVPRQCVRLRPVDALIPIRSARECSEPRAAILARQSHVRAMMARVAADIGNPRLKLVDPAAVLCDGQICPAVIGGVVMYRDDNHLSAAGARYVLTQNGPLAR